MPRISKKRQIELVLENTCTESNKIMMIREMIKTNHENDSSDAASESDESNYSHIHRLLHDCYNSIISHRYMFRNKYRSSEKWFAILNDSNNSFYSDTEFLSCFRMTRSSFRKLVRLLKTNEVFTKRQRPCEAQLLVFLYSYGCTDNNNTKLGRIFGFGSGTVSLYIKRVKQAILSMKASVIYWPSKEERVQLSKRIYIEYKFPNCVGIMDGTLIFLKEKPEYCGEDYNTRKGGYGVTSLIVCDDLSRVMYYLCGWAGSTHDNRVWRNSNMCLNPESYFSDKEYLLSDSAYTPCNCVVAAFKKGSSTDIPDHAKDWFNTQLAKPRIKLEHCNGLLKGRFPILTNINVKIKKRRHVKKVVEIFECCVILHNLLIDYGDPGEEEWYSQVFEDVGGYEDENEFLSRPIPTDGDGGIRRHRIFNYMLEQHNYKIIG